MLAVSKKSGISKYDAWIIFYVVLFMTCCIDIYVTITWFSEHKIQDRLWIQLLFSHHICAIYGMGFFTGVIWARSSAVEQKEAACNTNV